MISLRLGNAQVVNRLFTVILISRELHVTIDWVQFQLPAPTDPHTLADRLAAKTIDGLKVVLNDLLKVIYQSADQPAAAAFEIPKPAATPVVIQVPELDLDKT